MKLWLKSNRWKRICATVLIPLGATGAFVIVNAGTAHAGPLPYNNEFDTVACHSFEGVVKFGSGLQNTNALGTGVVAIAGSLLDCQDVTLGNPINNVQLLGRVNSVFPVISNFAPTLLSGCTPFPGTFHIVWSVSTPSIAVLHADNFSHLQFTVTNLSMNSILGAPVNTGFATPAIASGVQQSFQDGAFTTCGAPSDSAVSAFQGADVGAGSQLEIATAQDVPAVNLGAGSHEPGLPDAHQTLNIGDGDFYGS